MASAREKRDALHYAKTDEAVASRDHDSVRLGGMTLDEEPTMAKVQFTHIHLDKEIPRFGDKGLASSSSTFFKQSDGVTIELDTATGIVRLSKGGVGVNVPREKVAIYGDVVEPTAALKSA